MVEYLRDSQRAIIPVANMSAIRDIIETAIRTRVSVKIYAFDLETSDGVQNRTFMSIGESEYFRHGFTIRIQSTHADITVQVPELMVTSYAWDLDFMTTAHGVYSISAGGRVDGFYIVIDDKITYRLMD